MYKKIPTILVLGILASSVEAVPVQYFFFQDGYQNGAWVSGSFAGEPEATGKISTAGLTSFSLSFSGNSTVSAFSIGTTEFLGNTSGGFSYDPSSGSFGFSYNNTSTGAFAYQQNFNCGSGSSFCGNITDGTVSSGYFLAPRTYNAPSISADPISIPGDTPNNPILPITNEDPTDPGTPVFGFEFPVTNPEDFLFIDPDVAVGYDYVVDSGPNITSLLLPTGIGDNLFSLLLFDVALNDYVDAGTVLTGGTEYSFGVDGVDKFRIQGIETDANLDPTDPNAFVTGLKFSSTDVVSMSQIPISESVSAVPIPPAVWLFGSGLLGLVGVARRKSA